MTLADPSSGEPASDGRHRGEPELPRDPAGPSTRRPRARRERGTNPSETGSHLGHCIINKHLPAGEGHRAGRTSPAVRGLPGGEAARSPAVPSPQRPGLPGQPRHGGGGGRRAGRWRGGGGGRSVPAAPALPAVTGGQRGAAPARTSGPGRVSRGGGRQRARGGRSGATPAARPGLTRPARPRGPGPPPLPSAGPAGARRGRDGQRGGGRAPRARPGAASPRGRGSLRAVRGRGSLCGAGVGPGGAAGPGRLREAPLSRSCLSPYRCRSSLENKEDQLRVCNYRRALPAVGTARNAFPHVALPGKSVPLC